MVIINYMITKLTLLFTTLKPATAISLAILAIFTPIQPIIYGVLFLIFTDTITGIMAHYYKNDIEFHFWRYSSWKHITSSKLGNTITKSLVYMLVIISAFVIGTVIMVIPGLYVTKFFAGAICIREIKSLVENGEAILGGGFISTIRSFIKGGFKGGLNDVFKEKDKDKGE